MTKKPKSIFLKLPEYYFITMAILAGYTPPFEFNSFFMGIGLVLLVQIFFQNRILGMALGGIFFLVNILFLGALLSEFREFATFTDDAQKLIFVGVPLFIANFIFAFIMVYRHANQQQRGSALPV